jgi:exonuclease 3'-5' domain-containing protein 1
MILRDYKSLVSNGDEGKPIMSRFSVCVVDSIPLLDNCIANLSSERVTQLSLDLEGVDLCRYGRLSLIQILTNASDTIWLIDVTMLGATTFVHLDAEGRSLQAILENSATQKVTRYS